MKFGLKFTMFILLISIFVLPAHAQAGSFTPRAIVAAANTDRGLKGLTTLQEDPKLSQAAQNKANDMARRGYFSHLSPEGKTPWVWLKASGYYYERAGENLALNFSDAKTLESAWMRSPSHRANLLRQNYTSVGIGIAHGIYKGKPATFVVQFFATPYQTSGLARG